MQLVWSTFLRAGMLPVESIPVDGDVLCLRAGGQWAAPWNFSSLTAGAGIVTVLEFGRSWG